MQSLVTRSGGRRCFICRSVARKGAGGTAGILRIRIGCRLAVGGPFSTGTAWPERSSRIKVLTTSAGTA